MENDILRPPVPAAGHQLRWKTLSGSSQSLVISQLSNQAKAPILVITPDQHLANECFREIRFFIDDLPVLSFPSWETLPYDHFSPHEDLISERLFTLYHLPRIEQGVIVTAIPTLMQRLPSHQYVQSHTFLLTVGDALDLKQFRQQLISQGYRYTESVMIHGEFSVRGSIIDLFPMGSSLPFRIELFDNEVESIRTFDTNSQRSLEKKKAISVLPAHEFPLTRTGISEFRSRWRAAFPGNPMDSTIYQAVSAGQAPQGIEYYLPLFFDKLDSFFDYLPKNTIAIFPELIKEKADQFWQEVKQRYEQRSYDVRQPILQPSTNFIPVDELFGQIKTCSRVQLTERKYQADFHTSKIPDRLIIDHRQKFPLKEIQKFITECQDTKILFCAESSGRRQTLIDLLQEIKVNPTFYPTWQQFLNSNHSLGITVAPISRGFVLSTPKIAFITESDLFGKSIVMQRRLRKRQEQDSNALIRNLTELTIGSPVVHMEHGVARYLGLKTIKTGAIEAEYITLEFAGSDKIYVPVTSLHLISRYTGSNPDNISLQKLGSKQWEKIKEKANREIRDVAAELLDIYGRRQAAKGFSFNPPEKEFQKFRDDFPFEETPDQTRAINQVIQDMTSSQPMDRLICGDVGFGKTEVAMQAAFLAANSGKQVAILVPTSLLSSQHYENFKDRFADWPFNIAAFSRLQTLPEQKAVLKGLQTGTIDIVIGTHKLLNHDILFKDLGLLVVDEEHRFGVRQKERIKSIRANIDILTLTATPIPRTLNIALSEIRDLSIISTPPERRLAVKTFVHEYDVSLIREAVLRESMRGGQVYYLHNEVATIAAAARKLQELVPEAKIDIAHGQMKERELERVMSDFYHKKFNMLLCTTIIESGIDIPSANTIIIDRADKFGLAQLHQLRGRVGRSHHQAYAYLLRPSEKVLTADAKKRLEAISNLEELGAGFMLATHDLEIRGAGDLLGEAQSGQIHAIGFSLYMEMLEQAVEELKKGHEPTLHKPTTLGPEIDLHESALILANYIPDIHTRLTFYKRLSSCKENSTIHNLKAEMIDRFGLLPKETETLFKLSHLKLKLSSLGINKVEIGEKYGSLQFNEQPNIDPARVIQLIQSAPQRYQLQAANKIRFSIEKQQVTNVDTKISVIEEILSKLVNP